MGTKNQGTKDQGNMYLIISAVFILCIVAVFLLTGDYQKQISTYMPDSSSISLATKTCLDVSLSHAVSTVALNGGHFSLENYTGLLFGDIVVPYWMKDKISYIPTNEMLEEAINEELIQSIDGCLENISRYYMLDRVPPSVSTSVYEEYVSATLEPGLSVKTSFSITNVPPITHEQPFRLGLMRDYAAIIITHLNDSTKISTMQVESPFNVSHYSFGRDILYVISDYKDNVSVLTLQFIATPN